MTGLTTGWLARHTPSGTNGRNAALIDIAQDLLLSHLAERGLFDHLVFKGGTALRKLYAGNAGRFSTDLDFSVRDPSDDPGTVAELLRNEIQGSQLSGFTYQITDRRGRAHVSYDTPFGGVGNLTTNWTSGRRPGCLLPNVAGYRCQSIRRTRCTTAFRSWTSKRTWQRRSPDSPAAPLPAMSMTWFGSLPPAPTRASTAPTFAGSRS